MSDSTILTAERQSHSSSIPVAQKSKQPKTEDVEFLSLIDQIAENGKLPETYGDIGRYTQYIDSLIEGLEQEGLAGFKRAKTAILNKEKKLASLYAIHQGDQAQAAEQEQEQEDSRFFIKDDKGKRVLKLYSIEDIYKTPDAEYLVAMIIETATSSLLFGPSGTGKTFTALHLALCVAHGIDWHGRKVKQGIVWYVNTEGARGLKKRLKAWYTEHDDLSPTSNFRVIPWSLDLNKHFQDLLYTLEQQEEKPVLIVMDNFSMCTPGIDQNKQEQVAPVLGLINSLAQEQGSHVMMIHHTNKTGDFNGTMAFRNHVDTMIELRKEDVSAKDSAIIFSCQKARDDEKFRDIKTELKQVSLGINQVSLTPITSCVVVESETPIKAEGLKDTAQNILDILGSDTLLFSDWEKDAIKRLKISTATFGRARKELVSKSYVKKVKVTVDGKLLDHYCRVIEQEATLTESERRNEE